MITIFSLVQVTFKPIVTVPVHGAGISTQRMIFDIMLNYYTIIISGKLSDHFGLLDVAIGCGFLLTAFSGFWTRAWMSLF
jgi:hypothetical protein